MKAVALFSGGLDSTLAIKVMVEQGIEVVALNFTSPFCRCQRGQGCGHLIQDRAKALGASFKAMYLGSEYLEIVKNPKHGYGRNFNPCIDCRILKLKKAKAFMEEIGASFLFTGEVLGQRPMSQHRQALGIIEKEAGLEGLVVRPLSAKLLEPTLPEKKGWLKREVLLDISGRTRNPQIKLAEQLGIKDYPCPAGGCLLTDSGFCRRLKDLMAHNEFSLENIELLKIGRYFRISPGFKFLVGRNENENNRLSRLFKDKDLLFEPETLPGPLGLGRGECDYTTRHFCATIIARYTAPLEKVKVVIKGSSEEQGESLYVKAVNPEQCRNFMV